MLAAILAVGSELLGTERLDTNSLRLTALLDRHGVELRRKAVVGDSEEEIAAELRLALARADLILVTGGLGPTADDVTREAVAALLGRGLVEDPEVVAAIERRFAAIGWPMPAVNRKQAQVIAGAELIPNARGTAPGLRLEASSPDDPGRTVTLFLFPGVPAELDGMMASHLAPWLAERSGGVARETVVLKVACLPESAVEERIRPAYAEFGREAITILAKPGEIRLQATAAGLPEERAARLAAMSARLADLAGDAVFATRDEDSLEGVVGALLQGRGETVVVAESCTGGLLGERITRVAGSSAWFLGGVITYTDELKTSLVQVPAEWIAAHGAVSEPVARAMAEGVRRALGGTAAKSWGVGITGVAGPGGGSEAKPVGTVHIAVSGPAGPSPGGAEETTHRQARFPGDRERIRWQASQLALEMLRRRLLADGPAAGTTGSAAA